MGELILVHPPASFPFLGILDCTLGQRPALIAIQNSNEMNIKHYLTSGEAVDYLQQQIEQEVHYYDLDNLVRAEAVDPPPEMIAGRRMWSPETLQAAAKALRIRRAKRPNLTNKRSLTEQNN